MKHLLIVASAHIAYVTLGTGYYQCACKGEASALCSTNHRYVALLFNDTDMFAGVLKRIHVNKYFSAILFRCYANKY